MSAAGSYKDICFIPPSLLPNSNTLPTNVKLIDLNNNSSNNNNDNECGLGNLSSKKYSNATTADQVNIKAITLDY